MGAISYLTDRLTNLVANLNTGRDKQSYNTWTLVALVQTELEAAYRGDWLARKIIDIPPFDTVRAWRNWKAEQDAIKAIEATEKRLGVQPKLMRAMVLSRLYGGACLYMGVDGAGDPASELDPENVGLGALQYLHVLNRWEITAGQINRDVLSPYFGEPDSYQVMGNDVQATVHPSRVIRFAGMPIPDQRNQNDGWGDPVLQVVKDAVMQAGSVASNISSMTHEANVDVIRIPQFMESLATAGYSGKLINRFALAATTKSNNGMLLLDKDEEYERKELSFTSLADILDRFLQIVSGAADIPTTRLLGQSPAGLNATGESDIRNYYDRLSADQTLCVDPALVRLDAVLLRSSLDSEDTEEIHHEWAPLWQESNAEKAINAKAKAETSQIYATSGLVPIDALAKATCNQLVEDQTYPGLEGALADAEQTPEEHVLSAEEQARVDEQAALEAANNPPEPTRTTDAQPRTLYVCRPVKNAAAIVAWARAQGLDPVDGDEMHVTIAYSRQPIDWMKVGDSYDAELKVVAGGARLVEQLGPKNAIVLLFNSSTLAWRHEAIKRAGATWDFEDYQPHVTIAYPADGGHVDLDDIEPYRGEIVLGPELFDKIDDGYDPETDK